MRYMIIVKATKDSESGVLVDASGLQRSEEGWRIRYKGGKRTVIDGPFAETKELIAGYALIDVKSRDEALEWSRRFPNPTLDGSDCEIEVRRLFGLEDFGPSDAVERFRELGVGGAEERRT
ncbi:MAG: YciI family protein [Steroidobacteraceae bacterium]